MNVCPRAHRIFLHTPWIALLLALGVGGTARADGQTPSKAERHCQAASGRAAVTCLHDYVDEVRRCRDDGDSTCEERLRTPDGPLARIVAGVAGAVLDACTDDTVARINLSLGVDRYAEYLGQACEKWGDQFFEVTYPANPTTPSPAALACQHQVALRLARLRDRVTNAVGACNAAEFAGRRCRRHRRDRQIAAALAGTRRTIVKRCGPAFDDLGLTVPADGATLEARVDVLLDRVIVPARHYAIRAFPVLNLGPTARFGDAPVGVRTLDLVDASRQNSAGTGPRTLTVEVYYPSTPEAVAGIPRDVVRVVGIDVLPTPTYRDVARAPGAGPMIVYSHGSGGTRFENLVLAAHLASHGYLVVSADHPGDTLLDPGDDMTAVLVNRPKDVSFLIDRFVTQSAQAGDFFEGAVDTEHIGATGWSYGGYTALALAAGPFSLGTFTDPRVKAVMPLDGSAQVFDVDVPGIYATIGVPTLLLGGSSSPVIAPRLQRLFDGLAPAPPIVAYGDFLRAAHSSFADLCEVPEVLRGRPAACEPEFLPWRHVRHVESYLALNFFDAVLRGNAEALARLGPAALARIEELTFQRK